MWILSFRQKSFFSIVYTVRTVLSIVYKAFRIYNRPSNFYALWRLSPEDTGPSDRCLDYNSDSIIMNFPKYTVYRITINFSFQHHTMDFPVLNNAKNWSGMLSSEKNILRGIDLKKRIFFQWSIDDAARIPHRLVLKILQHKKLNNWLCEPCRIMCWSFVCRSFIRKFG
jgi:hypothetical protein